MCSFNINVVFTIYVRITTKNWCPADVIVKVIFLPTIVINLNNGKSEEETNGSREGDKEFAPADPGS